MQPYLQQQRQPSQQQPQYMMGGMQSGMSSAMKPMAPMYMPSIPQSGPSLSSSSAPPLFNPSSSSVFPSSLGGGSGAGGSAAGGSGSVFGMTPGQAPMFAPMMPTALPQDRPSASVEHSRIIHPLVMALLNPDDREEALFELSKRREIVAELAPILWHSFGVMSALLQEIVSIYPMLSPPTLTAHASNRVCNALALLQCVASHNETRSMFLNAHIPLFLYQFLNTTSRSKPFEFLRLTSLGVIGALVKNDSSEVVHFLLTSEIIPLCLRIMENGSDLSKTVAIFIVQKILLDEMGLQFVCQTYERFVAVASVLGNMVNQLRDQIRDHQQGIPGAMRDQQSSARLLKHIIRCYLRLCDNPRAREALRTHLPEALQNQSFYYAFRDDQAISRWLAQLRSIIAEGGAVGVLAG